MWNVVPSENTTLLRYSPSYTSPQQIQSEIISVSFIYVLHHLKLIIIHPK